MLLIAFILSGAALLFSLLIYLQHRRSETPVPDYEIGAAMGSIGVPLFLAGINMHFNKEVALALIIVGSLLTIWSAVVVFRARRRLRSGGR